MSSEKKDLDKAQNNQNNVCYAASNPDTAGPSENTLEKAAEMNDKSEGSREPA